MDEQKCLEGIVDLAVWRPAETKWFILDWKTNWIEREELDQLRAYYRPQIACYWKAVAELTKRPVVAGIYSTATGCFVPYGEKQLQQEWARLKTLVADQFAAETARVESDEVADSSGQLEFGEC